MAYNVSQGPRGFGDLINEEDVDTHIDWEQDKITFRTNSISRLVVENTQVSSSTLIRSVGSISSSGDLAVSGAIHATSLYGTITATGVSEFTNISGSGALQMVGNTILGGTLNVSGTTFVPSLKFTGVEISGSGKIQVVGTIESKGNIATSGSVTAGTSLIVGSADLNATDLEKLDGITDGTAAANKALVLDGSKNIATIGTVGCGAITSTGTSTFAAAEIGGGYGDTGITLLGVGTIKADGDLVVGGSVSGSGLVRLGTSLSASGDVAITGAVHAANFYGDGAGLTNVSATTATALSGTTAQLTTGVETSGYLKVSGSATLDGLTRAAAISGSGLLHAVGNASFGSDVQASGSISGSSTLQAVGNTYLGGTLNVSGTTFAKSIKYTGVEISGSGKIQVVGTIKSKGNMATSGSVTAASIVVGSADLNATDLEKLDGITDGTAAANKAVVLDGSKNIATIGTVGCGAITSTGTSTFNAVEVGGGYGDTGITLFGVGNIKADGDLVIGSAISGSGVARLGSSLSASGDIAVTGAIHAANFYGDGSGLTNVPGATSLSGTTAQLTTGVETSGYLNVSGAVTLNGLTRAAAISGSGVFHSVGAATFGGTVVATGSVTAASVVSSGPLEAGGIISGSGVMRLGGPLSASNDIAVTGAVHAANFYGDGSGLTNVPLGTTLSGTTAQLTTGVETSGYLKVSGSVTLDGLTKAASISGSGLLHSVGGGTFGAAVASSGSITAGTSFIIGSADMNEADLEKLDGITDGTAVANKAVVLDGSKNIATLGTVGCGAITSTGNSTYGTLSGGAISGSSLMRLGTSLSASGDVAVTGAVHAANFYGNGSGLTNLPAGTSLSGTTAQLTTGVETSGYLKVSGSTTLSGLTKAASISGSGLLHSVGTATFGAAVASSGSITAGTSFIIGSADINEADLEKLDGITDGTAVANKAVVLDGSKNIATLGTVGCGAITSTGISQFAQISGSGNLHFNGDATIGGAVAVTSSVTAAGVNSSATISGSNTLQVTGDSILGSGVNVSGTAYFADKIGVGVAAPKVGLDVHYDPGLLVNDTGGGEVGKFGLGSTTAGKLYYLHSGSSNWLEVNAASPESGSNQMIAIALGGSPTNDGMLLRGFFDFHTYLTGAFVSGQAVYVADSAGRIATYQPSGSGNVVRIAGHATNNGNVIYFNPSPNWIEV